MRRSLPAVLAVCILAIVLAPSASAEDPLSLARGVGDGMVRVEVVPGGGDVEPGDLMPLCESDDSTEGQTLMGSIKDDCFAPIASRLEDISWPFCEWAGITTTNEPPYLAGVSTHEEECLFALMWTIEELLNKSPFNVQGVIQIPP